MTQKKFSGFLVFLIMMNFIGLIFKIDLTGTYLFLAFMMFLLSLGMFIYLNIKITYLNKQENVNNETIATLNSVLAATPSSMVSSVMPYIVVTAINLTLKALNF